MLGNQESEGSDWDLEKSQLEGQLWRENVSSIQNDDVQWNLTQTNQDSFYARNNNPIYGTFRSLWKKSTITVWWF